MDDDTRIRYVNGRNAYAYPPIGLVSLNELTDQFDWQASFEQHAFNSTLSIDQYHCSHLRSSCDQKVLTGIYSVMYWGYITAGGRSINRCTWLSVGNAANPGTSLAAMGAYEAVKIIRESARYLELHDYRNALQEVTRLPHVGVSFGTKYLAFMDPENVGVLDERIRDHLEGGTYQGLIDEDVLNELTNQDRQDADRFHAYCVAINQLKEELNGGNARWRDTSGASLDRFRAIDVERALFALANQ